MNLITFLLRASWRILLLAIIAGLLSGASSTGLIALINVGLSAGMPAATTLIGGFAGLALLTLCTSIVSQILLVRLAQGAVFELRMQLSRRILATSLRHLEQIGSHRLLNSLINDVLIITNALLQVSLLCINITIILVCLIYIGWLSWVVLLVVLGFMAVGIYSYQRLMQHADAALGLAREEQDTVFYQLQAMTDGIKELKLHLQRRETFLSQLLQRSTATFRRHNVKGLTFYIAADSWGNLLFFIFIGLLLFALPSLFPVPVEVLTGCTLAILYMMTPLATSMEALPTIGRAAISLRKVEELGLSLNAHAAEPASHVGLVASPDWEDLELCGVTHTYHREREDSSFTLGPISLKFHPGELVFLIGGNGSGKTTFAKLLTGLYVPEAGQVRFNGQPITDTNREGYRQFFTVVFADFYLFEDLLGVGGPESDALARDYLARLQLDHKVQVKDGALSTTALSQGQRKRLALLTAYLEDRPFYVFDEWAADQEPLFRDLFYTQLLPDLKSRGKTVLVITHDDRYFHVADRVIKLDYGKIAGHRSADGEWADLEAAESVLEGESLSARSPANSHQPADRQPAAAPDGAGRASLKHTKRAPMRRLWKIVQRVVIALVVIALALCGGGYVWLRGSLPQISGTIQTAGISGPVEITRDTDAVPHIQAANEADAMFGLGYAHAQDRLWQMELQRRLGNGRLAELYGADGVRSDTLMRTLGIARAARSAWAHTSPETRRIVEAYVAGVNAFISTHHGRALSVEFTLLGFEPEPWRPEDVLVWPKIMAWNLGGNWPLEILRFQLEANLDAGKAARLFPAYPADGPVILPDGTTSARTENREPRTAQEQRTKPALSGGEGNREQRLGTENYPEGTRPRTASAPNLTFHASHFTQYDDLLALNDSIRDTFGLGGHAIGSNGWVLSGARTTTGKPLLANDPHLGAQTPSIWYLAHITGGKLDLIGATLPGVPAVLIGRNSRIAWGLTNSGADVQDLYQEHINDRNEVEYNGAWEPVQIVPEVIKVKDAPDVTVQVRITRHGPVLSDTFRGPFDPLALRWTALDEADHTVDAFIGMNAAENWEEFTAALANYQAPMVSFLYADLDGNIGYYAPGALPIRGGGESATPMPGWTDAYEWAGYVPFAQLPHTYNPPEGYIVTANNKIAPDSYPYPITSDWTAPFRAARIIELIEMKPKLSPDDSAAIQADVLSTQARALLPLLLQAHPVDDQSRAAIELLRGWDGILRGDSPQAAVYEAWYQQLPVALLNDDLDPRLVANYRGSSDALPMLLPAILGGAEKDWCDDVQTPAVEDCPAMLGKALRAGLDDMAPRQGGTNLQQWRWDRVHEAVFPHNPLDGIPVLGSIFSRRIPNGGDDATVNSGALDTSQLYIQNTVPSYRQIIDLGSREDGRFITAPGQSGNVLSGNYGDLLARWQRAEFIPMRYTPDVIARGVWGRLVLEP